MNNIEKKKHNSFASLAELVPSLLVTRLEEQLLYSIMMVVCHSPEASICSHLCSMTLIISGMRRMLNVLLHQTTSVASIRIMRPHASRSSY